MLGYAHVEYIISNNNNNRLQFKHAAAVKPYIENLWKLQSEYCGSQPIQLKSYDNRPNKASVGFYTDVGVKII